ncbi:hypothetical protein Tco_0905304, partial [Tanacetum coccineum]
MDTRLLALQNIPSTLLLRFLRENRLEWAAKKVDAYSSSAIKLGPVAYH